MLQTKFALKCPVSPSLHLTNPPATTVEILRMTPKPHCICCMQKDKILGGIVPEILDILYY